MEYNTESNRVSKCAAQGHFAIMSYFLSGMTQGRIAIQSYQ